jgi:hypothetical protein
MWAARPGRRGTLIAIDRAFHSGAAATPGISHVAGITFRIVIEGRDPSGRRAAMKRLILAALVSTFAASTFAASAYAQGPTCKAQADDQKFTGAVRKSFMDKCEKDATKSCGIAAAEKKLKGAAKTSFTKKCVTDSLGA